MYFEVYYRDTCCIRWRFYFEHIFRSFFEPTVLSSQQNLNGIQLFFFFFINLVYGRDRKSYQVVIFRPS